MKSVAQILIALLFACKGSSAQQSPLQKASATHAATAQPLGLQLEGAKVGVDETPLGRDVWDGNGSKLPALEPNSTVVPDSPLKSLDAEDSELLRIVLKDAGHLGSRHEEAEVAKNSIKYSVKLRAKPLNSLGDRELVQIVLKDEDSPLPQNTKEATTIAANVTDVMAEVESTAAENVSTGKPLLAAELSENSHKAEEDSKMGPPTSLASASASTNTTASKNVESTTKELLGLESQLEKNEDTTHSSSINLERTQNVVSSETVTNVAITQEPASDIAPMITDPFVQLQPSTPINLETGGLIEAENVTSHREELGNNAESSTESLEELVTTTTLAADAESTTKPVLSLEEYALKQMNFILDHLLLETQEFVTSVLQASLNSVFPRDQLKLYAEGLNNVLNPDIGADYSYEYGNREALAATPDEIYDSIVQKLRFLKSKPSKFLQRHLPQDWIAEYRKKREELVIWLDKATEQMHEEFNKHMSEEEDYIKYKYFNETFDDICRATEIHNKLALLADLVKIVKNKKQITFMDLYMQT